MDIVPEFSLVYATMLFRLSSTAAAGVSASIVGVYDVWLGGTGPGRRGAYVDETAAAQPLHAQITIGE